MTEKTQYKIRLLVAERIDLIRMGLRRLFEHHPAISLVEAADHIADLLDLTARHQPDVILMDFELVNDQCAEHISRLMDICSHSKILLFSHQQLNDLQFSELPPGVAGIISKYGPCNLLVSAICAIYANPLCHDKTNPFLPQMPQSPVHAAKQSSLPGEISASFHPELNSNERRVAHLAGKGLSAREISQQLLLTEKTVRNYLSAVYKKMGVKKQVELCLRAPLHNFFQD